MIFGFVVVGTPAVGLAGSAVLDVYCVGGLTAHGTSVFLLKL